MKKKIFLLPLLALILAGCGGSQPTELTVVAANNKTQVVVGETVQLSVEMTPSNAKKDVTWTTSKEDVATVSEAGLVTAVKAGAARITATSTAVATVKNYIDIIVKDLNPTKITVTAEGGATGVAVGKKVQLSVAIEPTGANPEVKWSTSDALSATVSNKGLVAGVKEAAAVTLTATSVADATIKGEITLAITPYEEADAISGYRLAPLNSPVTKAEGYVVAAYRHGVMLADGPDASDRILVYWGYDGDNAGLTTNFGIVGKHIKVSNAKVALYQQNIQIASASGMLVVEEVAGGTAPVLGAPVIMDQAALNAHLAGIQGVERTDVLYVRLENINLDAYDSQTPPRFATLRFPDHGEKDVSMSPQQYTLSLLEGVEAKTTLKAVEGFLIGASDPKYNQVNMMLAKVEI